MKESTMLRLRRQDTRDEISRYRRRRTQVQSVLNSVERSFDGDIERIRSKNQSMRTEGENGFGGLSHIYQVNETIASEIEKSEYEDSAVSSIMDNLRSELRNIDSRISSLERDVSRLNSQITNAENRERQEFLDKLMG